MRKILIRFDDICPTMDKEQWNKAMELVDRYGIKPLIGVIPDCQDSDLQIDPPDPEFWDYIKRLQDDGFTIAMHGYQHICISEKHGIVNRRKWSEFAGLPYSVQYERLASGKKILFEHGIRTNVFIAPSHSYDKKTLKALSELGFKYISDGKTKKPIIRNGIICLPCRNSGTPIVKDAGSYTAIYHAHEWTQQEKKAGYDNLVNVIDNYGSEIVSFRDYCEQDQGCYIYQVLCERIYIIWSLYIKPGLANILRGMGIHR